MKEYLAALVMAQSMFCALPCPLRVWKEEARAKMLLFLPLIGLEIGGLWVLATYFIRVCKLPDPFYGLILTVLPYLATGFIHLDGFLDVTDAIGSWRPLERRREILKDSHVGSFAVVGCCLLMLAGYAFFSAVPKEAPVGCLSLIPVVSRCCSTVAVCLLPPMSTSQYAGGIVTEKKREAVVVSVLCLFCIVAGFYFFGRYGWTLVGGLVGYLLALRKSYRLLEGMNGDISGFSLTICELCAVAVYALL